MPTKPSIISLGGGLRLYSLDSILEAFSPSGLTMRGLLRLLRALNVPYLEVGRTRYVHLLQFQIALYALLRIGQPPFHAPGTKKPTPPPSNSDRTGGECQQANLVDLVTELLYARKLALNLTLTRSQITADARTLADTLMAQVPHTVTARALASFTEAARALNPVEPSLHSLDPPPFLDEEPCPTNSPNPIPSRTTSAKQTPSTASSPSTDAPTPSASPTSTRPNSSDPSSPT